MNAVSFKILGSMPYEKTILDMDNTVKKIILKEEEQQVWFLEHESVYTFGTSAKKHELLNPLFPVIETGRGGKFTYHGPGQLVGYVMIHLKDKDIKKYVQKLSNWIILSLKNIGISAFLDEKHVGIWVSHKGNQKKIASIGIRITKWVTWHGFSINIDPNLDHFKGIIPCGINHFGVTSLKEMGLNSQKDFLIDVLTKNFTLFF